MRNDSIQDERVTGNTRQSNFLKRIIMKMLALFRHFVDLCKVFEHILHLRCSLNPFQYDFGDFSKHRFYHIFISCSGSYGSYDCLLFYNNKLLSHAIGSLGISEHDPPTHQHAKCYEKSNNL